jgi:hypothetical protein
VSSSKPIGPSFSDLLKDAQKSALKLELRDSYLPNDPAYLAWLAGDREETYRRYAPWPVEVSGAVARGVEMRRVRVVSDPVSDYIRFEHAVTDRVNIAGGEQVRWLPRSRAWDLLLPTCDLWIVDERVALFYLFSAEGESAGSQVSADPAVVERCVSAFAGAWDRGVDHAEYRP